MEVCCTCAPTAGSAAYQQFLGAGAADDAGGLGAAELRAQGASGAAGAGAAGPRVWRRRWASSHSAASLQAFRLHSILHTILAFFLHNRSVTVGDT